MVLPVRRLFAVLTSKVTRYTHVVMYDLQYTVKFTPKKQIKK
jgi:hypothetical protein